MEKITFKNFPYKTTPLNDTNLNQLQTNVEIALDDKVDKVEGKGLSTSDYTTTEKNKLAGIEPGANKTTIADNLTTDDSTKVLSAKQGKLLNDTKFDKTGGTVTGDVNITGSLQVNGEQVLTSDTGWINMNLLNGWLIHSVDYQSPQYRKIGDFVYLRGLVRRENSTERNIAMVPLGFRPSKIQAFAQVSEEGDSVYVRPDGYITTGGSYLNGTWITLDGIIFSIA